MARAIWGFVVRLAAGLEVALGGILTGGLRSVLTVLGVAIGVASVVSLVAVGEGARQAVAAQYQSLGTNIITVESHSAQVRLTARTAADLELRIPFVSAAMPVLGVSAPVRWRGTSSAGSSVTVLGVTPQLLDIRREAVFEGSFLTPLEETHALNVAVLGYDAAQSLFGGLGPVGQDIYIGQAPFRIVGVLAYQGGAKIGSGQVTALVGGSGASSGSGSGGSGGSGGCGGGGGASSGSGSSCAAQTVSVGSGIDQAVLIPESSAEWFTHTDQVSAIWMKAASRQDVEPAVLQAQRILENMFGLAATSSAGGASGKILGPLPPGYCPNCNSGGGSLILPGGSGPAVSVQSLNDLVKQADAASRVLTLMLAAIAGVSLLVGGIGVMNIMLVSVRERTVEIGLRKALGALQLDLLYQFVLEALLVSALGGAVGWLGGLGGVHLLLHYGVQATPLPGSLFVALGSAAGVGVLFGTYPAYLASELQPVEALRRQ